MPTFMAVLSRREIAHLALASAIALFSGACADSVSPGRTLHVSTTSPEFVLISSSEWARVTFRTSNLGSAAVYLRRCGDRVMAAVERWESGKWVQVSGDGCLAVNDMSAVPLQPGASRDDLRSIGERGRYRLRLGIARSPNEQPAWDALSNTFDVK